MLQPVKSEFCISRIQIIFKMMRPPDKKVKSKKPKKPAYKIGAANEYADVSEDQQKALHERIRDNSGAKRLAAQDIQNVTSSIVTALAQALHTNDQQMLDDILQDTSTATISTTIRRMEAGLALQLLQKCTQIFQKEPTRAQQVLPWIKESLNVHAVFLMSQPDMHIMLAPVQQVIKEHLATFDKVLLLQGRLELLLSRLPAHTEIKLNPRPLSRFLEESEDFPNFSSMADVDIGMVPLLDVQMGQHLVS